MSVNGTIDQLIAVSQGSLAEMRLAGEGLDKAISTTVMGLSPAGVASRKSSIRGELVRDYGVHLPRKHVCAQNLPAGLALSKLGRRGGRVHCNRFS